MTTKKDLQNFAFIWSAIFTFVTLIPLLTRAEFRLWSIMLALLFLIIGIVKPFLLEKFYKIWTKFGELIGGFVSKIMLFVLFYIVFTPIAFLLRLSGKDMLNKKIDKNQSSYWIERERQPESMKNQF